MKTEAVREYTILYQYLLLLKEPLYVFLIQIFQHLSPVSGGRTLYSRFSSGMTRRISNTLTLRTCSMCSR
jgi:hypothetical protein